MDFSFLPNTFPQDHRMAWVQQDLKDYLVPSPAMDRDTFH